MSSLRGQACLELGAGYVLAEPLLFSLLGARHACALDYNAIATLTGTWHSLRQASPQDVVAALEGIDLPEELAPTLAQLAGGTREAFAERLRQDVAYLAPYDVSSHALTGRYHLIDSVSVLEHVPPSSLRGLLGNLLASLEPGGVCINQIDLRDHRDPEGQPLAFLAEQDYGDALADTCGNRLRRSHWEALFAGFEDYQTVCVHARSVARDKIPAQLAPGFQALEVDDLATTELLMVSRRRG